MYKSTLFLLGFFMAMLIGCQTPSSTTTAQSSSPPPQTYIPQPPPPSVKIEDSKFENTVTFVGIQKSYGDDKYNKYFLRSWLHKTSDEVRHQLYVSDYYKGDWEFWSRANSQDAQPLEFVSISRDVIYCGSYGGCSHAESFGALIPDAILKAHQDSFTVKFYAKSGKEMVITLTSQQIQMQLKAIEDFQASKNK